MRKTAALVLASGFLFGGAVFAQSPAPVDKGQENAYESLDLFDQAFERIRQDAVDKVADSRLIGAAIGGMLAGLDPHAAYLDAAALKAAQGAAGAGDTVGLAVTVAKGTVKVISPRDGSPAAKAGLQPGDVIYTIDREPTWDMDLSQVEAKLAGPPGSTVKLLLRRGAGAPMTVTVTRAAWHQPSVGSRLDGGDIGYVRIAGFDAGTAAALASAAAALQQQAHGRLIGYVLDLRDNPGGSFAAAVAAADAFLDKGDIALIKGRKGETKHIAATPGDVAKGLPLVALVNGGTAREAELVAGALQDNHRAVLLGSKTYGESAIETLIALPSGGAIRLTTARFETPDGRRIEGKGLEPDLKVAPLKLQRFAETDIEREADLPGALKNPNPKPPPGAPPGATASPPARKTPPAIATKDIGTKRDEQLTQAEDVLRGLARLGPHNSG